MIQSVEIYGRENDVSRKTFFVTIQYRNYREHWTFETFGL